MQRKQLKVEYTASIFNMCEQFAGHLSLSKLLRILGTYAKQGWWVKMRFHCCAHVLPLQAEEASCPSASSWLQGALGAFGPLKKSLRSGPKGPLGPWGPLKKSLRSGIHAQNPPKWSATSFISCPEKPQMGGFAVHFGMFWA